MKLEFLSIWTACQNKAARHDARGASETAVRDEWLESRLRTDISGPCEACLATDARAAADCRRIAAQMGAPGWLA